MTHISSYSKVFTVGHKWVTEIFKDDVVIQEKIDGSQLSFGMIEGVLTIRSKGADIYTDNPPKMFKKAVDYILSIKDKLEVGYIYRGEYLQKPKHNVLAYDRVPKNNIILFDVDRKGQNYCSYDVVYYLGQLLDLETVPLLFIGKVKSLDQLKEILNTESILGGQNIEGVVIKSYNKFTDDKKTMMAKYVSEKYQEIHDTEWKKANPTRTDIITKVIEKYRTDARWEKAIQHLRELEQITDTPADIGKLMKEVKADTKAECEDEIKQILFDYFWKKDIERSLVHGLPEWYKERLASGTVFESEPA